MSAAARWVACALCAALGASAPAHGAPRAGAAPTAAGAPRAGLAHAELEFERSRRAEALRGVRGVTIGPIEDALHPNKGYGSDAYVRTLREARKLGANWVALTPFGRVGSLDGLGVDPTFEAPFADNQLAIERAVRQAHAHGLKVMLVPHLWVESGDWRALIDPKTDQGWRAWAASYRRYVLAWAQLAERSGVDLLSLGVELRSWVTTARAPSFLAIAREVRQTYRGLLTYSGNWDDVEDTCIWSAVDVVGINAFYPLTDQDDATPEQLRQGGEQVQEKLAALAAQTGKPVLFTEMGYTTRRNAAKDPWEWPDGMKGVKVDPQAQADAYRGLLGAAIDSTAPFAGFFVWRLYADPDDVSQESELGFSPRGKLAELPLREAFLLRWASEPRQLWRPLDATSLRVGVY